MVKKRSGEERVGFSTGSKPPFLIKTPVIYVVIYKMITISLLNTSMTARRRGKEMTPTGSPVAIATLPFSNLEIPRNRRRSNTPLSREMCSICRSWRFY